MRFYYSNLVALMPGVTSADDWSKVIETDLLPESEVVPPCPVPVMVRRRMTALGRLALTALAQISPEAEESVVYASSWGEIGRTAQLVGDVAADPQAMSPAGFSSSVHNAIAGIASIWQKNHAAGPAVTAGTLTTEAALVQCAARLAAGARSVILLRYDEPLPELWQTREHRYSAPSRMFAWAMRLMSDPESAEGSFALDVLGETQADVDEVQCRNCPADLFFLLGKMTSRVHTDYSSRGYRWVR
ncbi:MAG: beta-ketoacyl synthase chain length factor [Sutterellaceae bacterium]|nr:beta-ketoacyl synthase chain length factor [Sutterellaceae bacterium]